MTPHASTVSRLLIFHAAAGCSRSHELDDVTYRKYLGNTFFNDDIQDSVRNVIESFRPDNFDADIIVDLAVAAGMKYITFTSQHICGRMFMFDTTVSEWNSRRVLDRDLPEMKILRLLRLIR